MLFRSRHLGDSHVTVANSSLGCPCFGTAEFPQWGWNLPWRSGAAGRGRGGGSHHSANPAPDTATHAPRRQRMAVDARGGSDSLNLGTWNSIIFSGLPIGTRIPVRVAFPGGHGGCAGRYARFWLLNANDKEVTLSRAVCRASFKWVWMMAQADRTNCGARRFHHSANS